MCLFIFRCERIPWLKQSGALSGGRRSHAADWLRRIIWEAAVRGEHRPQRCWPLLSHYPASRPLSRRRQTRPRVRERSKVHGLEQVDETGMKKTNNNAKKKNWKLIVCKFKQNRILAQFAYFQRFVVFVWVFFFVLLRRKNTVFWAKLRRQTFPSCGRDGSI